MDVNSVYSSGNFFRASDVINTPRILTIQAVTLEEMKDGKRKFKLAFNETDQTLLLNKTNAMIVGGAYGPETDEWLGRKIKLRAGKTTYQGKLTDCINVECSTAGVAAGAAKQTVKQDERNPPDDLNRLDDEVPF